jgi:hypothetical protein
VIKKHTNKKANRKQEKRTETSKGKYRAAKLGETGSSRENKAGVH